MKVRLDEIVVSIPKIGYLVILLNRLSYEHDLAIKD